MRSEYPNQKSFPGKEGRTLAIFIQYTHKTSLFRIIEFHLHVALNLKGLFTERSLYV
jgi:hypothetical protein